MYLLGYDIGSSSVKATLVDASTGKPAASEYFPKNEMQIKALKPGWAEQDPEEWWKNLKLATASILNNSQINKDEIKAIGISYQMHGLIAVDKHYKVVRPAIIWCDSRAVPFGEKAFMDLGSEFCLSHLLNSPGNFTASKLKWVKENEPELFSKIHKIMLPGDYIAMRMSGEVFTTVSGLSEGIFWDFKNNTSAGFLMEYYGLDNALIPEILPTFSIQGQLSASAATELGLAKGTIISYRAGDQPNNAFSLNVLNPGEVAATAGTSGVIYGISEEIKYDPFSRVNTFAHVNHTPENENLGVLLCINGTGILYSWLKKLVTNQDYDYNDLNKLAASVSPGSDGISILPFGNGAERVLGNKEPGCQISKVNFNSHSSAHLIRAAQEGIAFAFHYGLNIMNETGIKPTVIRAGNANLFLSPVFREALASITGVSIELYDTDGSQGAAKGAGIGAGIYKSFDEAFNNLSKLSITSPFTGRKEAYDEAYMRWLNTLNQIL
jgi:xylulokinase